MALTDADKESLSATLDDLVRETPRTKSAAARYRELAGKAGGSTNPRQRSLGGGQKGTWAPLSPVILVTGPP